MKMLCVGQTQNCPSACYVLRFLYVIMVMLEWVSVMGILVWMRVQKEVLRETLSFSRGSVSLANVASTLIAPSGMKFQHGDTILGVQLRAQMTIAVRHMQQYNLAMEFHVQIIFSL